MISDYRIYRMDKKEKVFTFLEGMLFNGLIAFLIYDSVFAMIPGMILLVIYFKEKRRTLARKRMRAMRVEFGEFLNTWIAVLQTGKSMENAFIESCKDTAEYLGSNSVFLAETKYISGRIINGEPLEKLLVDFAKRSHMEELEYFSEVFSVGKRSGGNFVGIIKNTVRMIQERLEAEEEIDTILTEKQFEFHIMCIIPFAMIGYLRIGAGNLIDCMYKNLTGVLIMTVCLVIYGGCYFYGKRILEIK